jgi:hypothetical protein
VPARIGEWLSLVERLAGGQEIAGSTPVSPTIKKGIEIIGVLTRMWCNLVAHDVWDVGVRFKSGMRDHLVGVRNGMSCL